MGVKSESGPSRPRRHLFGLLAALSGLAGTLTAVVLGLFFAFILVAAFAPKVLAAPLSAGGVTTIAVPLGLAMIVLFWLLTGFYVLRAKRDFDEMKNEILREVAP